MNLHQAKVLLDKINALYHSVSMESAGPSSIERDLMLSYLRQLYEAFLDGSVIPSTNNIGVPVTESVPPPVAKPEPPPRPEPSPKKYTPPRIVEIPDSLKEIPVPEPETVAAKPIPEKKPEPVATVVKAPVAGNPKIESLFSHREAKELSEKLSERPVSDLTKAMAINDRLLYINDLFGKDQGAMDESLKLLNKFSSMEEAKGLLQTLAEQFNWIDEERQETAVAFIKLVRRRYV